MTSQEDRDDASTSSNNVPPRQCGRCRQLFDGDPTLDAPAAIPDWWLCPACHVVLIGD